MEVKYYCHTGKFFKLDEPSLSPHNRAFSYGDGLFETIHCLGTTPQFMDLHWERLSLGMKSLKMEPDEEFTKETLIRSIEKLLNKNRIFKGARIRITVFRNEGGLYTPQSNKVSWTMQSTPLKNEKYELNQAGLHVDIFDEVHKPINPLSSLKSTNALLYILAGIYRKDLELDECFILNQYGRIAESLSSNIFLVFDKRIITPPLSEGCIAGTMRVTVLRLAKELGYEVEEKGILEKNLLDAEEIFITNAIQGIKWVGAYREKRYFNFAARKLIVALNQEAFSTSN